MVSNQRINPFKSIGSANTKSAQLTEIINRLACLDQNLYALFEKVEFIECVVYDLLPEDKKHPKSEEHENDECEI